MFYNGSFAGGIFLLTSDCKCFTVVPVLGVFSYSLLTVNVLQWFLCLEVFSYSFQTTLEVQVKCVWHTITSIVAINHSHITSMGIKAKAVVETEVKIVNNMSRFQHEKQVRV